MNTTEERAQMLYDKALTELNTYLEDMKTKPPQEIINSAYTELLDCGLADG